MADQGAANPPAANTRNAAANRQQQPAVVAAGGAAPAVDAEQEGKHDEADAAALQPANNNGAAANADADRVAVANMMQEMLAMKAEIERLKQAQPQPSQQSLSLDAGAGQQADASSASATSELAMLFRTMQDHQADLMRQQAAAQADQMRRQAAQQNLLQSLGDLPTFSGKGADTTLLAHDWLRRADKFFAAREQAMGITATQGDQARLLSAVNALTDSAERWYNALPLASQPSDWTEFGNAVRARFCSVPSERIRVDKLQEFVEKAARIREKLNVQGMQAFTTQFAQLAGEVPDDLITLRGKLAMLARGVPQRYAEIVLKEEAKKPTPPLHEVITTILSRAANKEQAVAYGGASSSSGAAAASVDAISLAVVAFGWTREEAARHLEDGEGWAARDTMANEPPPPRASSQAAAFADAGRSPMADDQLERLVNALAARVGAGPAARDRNASNNRRSVPGGVANEVPAELANARKEAGLCIKCGVTKYEPGGKGHNSRTCKLPADKTTSAVEGKKKANF